MFTTAQFAPAAGSLLFTMGCHSGLNVPDIGVAAPNPAQQASLLDWAQAATSRGALYVGQSGFGYGDTEAVAYSERLLQYFAENLATRSMTAAQALMFAQQRYVGDLGVIGVYDAKIVEISTFYGLPMWRIGAGGTEAPSAMPADGASTGRLSTAQFAAAPDLEEVESANGSYWTANGELPQVTHFRPIQPRMTIDVPAGDGLTLHGAVIETLVSVDVPGVDPVYDRPVVDLGGERAGAGSQRRLVPGADPGSAVLCRRGRSGRPARADAGPVLHRGGGDGYAAAAPADRGHGLPVRLRRLDGPGDPAGLRQRGERRGDVRGHQLRLRRHTWGGAVAR